MRILLDTHMLIWAMSAPAKLTKQAKDVLTAERNEIFFSAASIWEIAIKSALRRIDLAVEPHELPTAARESGFLELPVFSSAAAAVATLPLHHRDPFDRLLIAQAICEPARLLTADRLLSAYSELVMVA